MLYVCSQTLLLDTYDQVSIYSNQADLIAHLRDTEHIIP